MAVEVEKLLGRRGAHHGARRRRARARRGRDSAARAPHPRKVLLRDRPDAPATRSDSPCNLRADELLLVCLRARRRAGVGGFDESVPRDRASAARARARTRRRRELAQSVWADLYGRGEGAGGAPGQLAYTRAAARSAGGCAPSSASSPLTATGAPRARPDRGGVGLRPDGRGGGDTRRVEVAPPADPKRRSPRARPPRACAPHSRAPSGLEDEDRLLVKLYYFETCVCARRRGARRTRGDGEPPLTRIHGRCVNASR